MLRIVVEMDVDLETLKHLKKLSTEDICRFVTPGECDSESYCGRCAMKYEHRIPRIISIDTVSEEKI